MVICRQALVRYRERVEEGVRRRVLWTGIVLDREEGGRWWV